MLLVLVLMLMYIFASQTARQYMHNTFWMFHKLFVVLYTLLILHGLMWLTQKPNFYAHFIAPALLFTADRIMSISRRKMKLDIVHADILPSCTSHRRYLLPINRWKSQSYLFFVAVTRVLFKRPAHFDYKSGMWVRIACDALSSYEYHPFTLTSSPHEDYLSLHIRAVGPWTKNIRSTLQTCLKERKPLPSVSILTNTDRCRHSL